MILSSKRKTRLNGVLLLHATPIFDANAPTIGEHASAFAEYSMYPVCSINVGLPPPRAMETIEFSIIVIHYSAFMAMNKYYVDYVGSHKDSTVIAFYQDEMHNWDRRIAAIKKMNVREVYSCLEPKAHAQTYYKLTSVRTVHHCLTGYVADSLKTASLRHAIPFAKREIDVGYRSRPLPYYMGRGAQEKVDIATGFLENLSGYALTTDIKTGELDRIYGDDWHRFVANCKAMLGVESGVSIIDLDGSIEEECEKYVASYPDCNFRNLSDNVLSKYEDNIFYRTISPRAFECAAFKVVMIFFEGHYNNILFNQIVE